VVARALAESRLLYPAREARTVAAPSPAAERDANAQHEQTSGALASAVRSGVARPKGGRWTGRAALLIAALAGAGAVMSALRAPRAAAPRAPQPAPAATPVTALPPPKTSSSEAAIAY